MRFDIRPLLAALVISTATASAASAQAHQRVAGDTLRFLQTSKMSQTMESDVTGTVTQSLTTDARVVAVFGRGDTITSWMDSARSSTSSPMGDFEPDMSFALNKKQVATLSSTGVVAIINKADILPPELAGMSDAMPETIYGLEMDMPKEPLRKGLVWTDTVTEKSKPGSQNAVDNTSITRYEVVADSTIAGRPVLVVQSDGTADIAMTMTTEGTGTVTGKMAGTVKGRMYYSTQLGILLRRSVSTTMKGTQELRDMGVTMTVSQTDEETTALIQ
ncbi:MAG TPA: hypothetical protein VF035_09515 [Longimicrobiales bacterium]